MIEDILNSIRRAIRMFSRKEHPIRREMTEALLLDVIKLLAKELRENVVVVVDLKGKAKVAYVDTATVYAITHGNMEENLKRLVDPDTAQTINRYETVSDYNFTSEVFGQS